MLENCPNCGAPGIGTVCEYCGTVLASPEDIVRMMEGRPAYIYFFDKGHVHALKVHVHEVSQNTEYTTVYSDNDIYKVFPNRSTCTIEVSLMPIDETLKNIGFKFTPKECEITGIERSKE